MEYGPHRTSYLRLESFAVMLMAASAALYGCDSTHWLLFGYRSETIHFSVMSAERG
jgi:hypothetical protein